jgi:hypothetical protein
MANRGQLTDSEKHNESDDDVPSYKPFNNDLSCENTDADVNADVDDDGNNDSDNVDEDTGDVVSKKAFLNYLNYAIQDPLVSAPVLPLSAQCSVKSSLMTTKFLQNSSINPGLESNSTQFISDSGNRAAGSLKRI